MIHTKFASKLRGFPFTLWTRSAIYGSQWPTVLVDEVKGTPRNFEWYLCGYLKHLSNLNYTVHNKRLQTLFKDQLVRSKATCSYNHYLWPRTRTRKCQFYMWKETPRELFQEKPLQSGRDAETQSTVPPVGFEPGSIDEESSENNPCHLKPLHTFGTTNNLQGLQNGERLPLNFLFHEMLYFLRKH